MYEIYEVVVECMSCVKICDIVDTSLQMVLMVYAFVNQRLINMVQKTFL